MALEIRRLVGNNRIANSVGLVKRIVCKGNDLIIQRLRHILTDAICNTSGNSLFCITIDKHFSFCLDDLHFLFGNRPADIIRLTHGITTQPTENLNNLFLVDDASVGDLQNRLQFGTFIGDLLVVQLVFNKLRNGIHRAGTVQRHDSGNVLNAVRFHAHANTGHSRRFQLEHALGLTFCQHFKGFRIIIRNSVHGEVRVEFLNLLFRVPDNRQVTQAQEVHFQKSQFLNGGHGVLGDDRLIIARQRDIGTDRVCGNHDTGSMGGGISGHALQTHCSVDQLTHTLVPIIHFLKLRRYIECVF